ncbi:NAD-dependent epimerase/dehydratase family protein [Rhodococcus sp. IEGM 1341]|uniref:NAD-dependent epimerase/dehydratase family protein n=1 Tax=Rhodococcus sp. IEGM 1341 TaxID=3047090 RepID=UPI0024B794A2|nr:NAD-dependent epimerase/dehydratase family protein [Rhodococcus sp. IEGM 1341]MDI9926233.1 NAD-dependent epimerase/dehydratase family protein [Rhodococcus sp. IEGM 1341]
MEVEKQMKTLVTGAAGFVGSNLCQKLLQEGHEVVGLDCFTDYYDTTLKRRNVELLDCTDFTLCEADINTADLEQLVGAADVVFHQAGQPGVRGSWGSQFSLYCDSNILATQKLLEAAKKSKSLTRFVYASSSSIYGNADRYPTSEVDLPAPLSPYGVSKLAGEHLCSLYAENFGVPTVSLRYFTVYGPRQRPDMAFTRFTKAAVTNTPITLFGDGSQIRDFTFIDDIVNGNILAATATSIDAGVVYNLSGGSRVSVNEVLQILQELAVDDLIVKRQERFAGDVMQTGGTSEKAANEIGWSAEVSLEQGLAAQYEWAVQEFTSGPRSQ